MTCAKLASGVLAFAAGRAAAASAAAGRLLRRVGAGNIALAATVMAMGFACCAWPRLALEVAAWTAGTLLLALLLSAAPDAFAVLFFLTLAGMVAAMVLC